MSNTSRSCFSGCEFFRCDQRAVVFRGQNTYCRFADDECTPSGCKYTRCVKGRLLPSGVCALSIKPRTLEVRPEEFVDPMEIPDNLVHRTKFRRAY